MSRLCALLVPIVLLSYGCNERARQSTEAEKAPSGSRAPAVAREQKGRIAQIQSECDKSDEGGRAAVEAVRNWVPTVNERKGDRPIREIAAMFVSKGVHEICWAASLKSTGSYKVVYNYIDIAGAFRAAEWEFDPKTGAIRTFNADSMEFWTGKL
jgi:hypothetical protein